MVWCNLHRCMYQKDGISNDFHGKSNFKIFLLFDIMVFFENKVNLSKVNNFYIFLFLKN